MKEINEYESFYISISEENCKQVIWLIGEPSPACSLEDCESREIVCKFVQNELQGRYAYPNPYGKWTQIQDFENKRTKMKTFIDASYCKNPKAKLIYDYLNKPLDNPNNRNSIRVEHNKKTKETLITPGLLRNNVFTPKIIVGTIVEESFIPYASDFDELSNLLTKYNMIKKDDMLEKQ